MEAAISKELLERILDTIPDSIAIFSREGRIAFINAAAEKVFGLTRKDIIGRAYNEPAWKITTVDGKPYPEEELPFAQAIRTAEAVSGVEFAVERSDGARIVLSVFAAPLLDGKGMLEGIVTSFTDITERKKAEEELRKSEANYRAIFNAVNDAIFVHDIETGGILDINEKATEMYGYTAAEAKRLNVADMSAGESPYSQEDALGWIGSAAKGEPQIIEWLAKDKAGRLFWVEVSIKSAIIDGNQRLLAIVRDISERKRAEEKLRKAYGELEERVEERTAELSRSNMLLRREIGERSKAEERLRLFSKAVEEAPDGVQITDSSGILIYSNKATEEIYGYTPEEFQGKHVNELNADPDYANEVILPSIQKTGRWAGELMAKHKDGSIFPIWLTTSMVRDDKGNLIALVGIIRDITELKRAEEALRTSEKKLRGITSVLGEGVYVLDGHAHLTFMNPEAERLLGWAEKDLMGKDVHDIIHYQKADGTNFPTEECPVFRVISEGSSYRTENDVFIRKDGTKFPVSYISTAIVEDGKVAGVVNVFQDITERKRAEARLREEKRLSDALNDINAAVNSALTFGEIMQRVVVDSAKAIGAETAAIDLREGDLWVARHIYGLPEEIIGVGLTDKEAPQAALAVSEKRPIAIDDTDTDGRVNREVMRRFNIRSVLTVPLVVRGDVIGALFFNYHSAPITFTEAQIDFANKVAASVSLALENARLFQQVESDRKDLEILNEIELDITSDLQFKNLMHRIADSITRLVEADAAGIAFWDEDKRKITDVFFMGIPAYVADTLKSTPSVTKSIIESKRPGLVEDYPSYPSAVKEFTDIGLQNAAIIPIVYKEKVLGAIHALGLSRERNFNKRDVRLLEAVARTVAIAIENARLYEAERSIADILQESLLVVPQRIEGVEFDYLYRSATEAARVGGDFYDIFEIERGKVGIIIGDVSGKGIEAAALTSMVKSTIKAHAVESSTPAIVMLKTNDLVFKYSPDSIFVTVFFGVLDLAAGRLTYCSAGHPPAIIRRKTGIVKVLSNLSPIIGAFGGMRYRSGKEKFEVGDTLVLYTDGIIEARQNSDFFGEKGLVELVEHLEKTTVKELPLAIFNKVKDFTKGRLSDDIALLCVSIDGKEDEEMKKTV